MTCQDCGQRLARYRRSKLVEQPERYACGSCGGQLVVEANEGAAGADEGAAGADEDAVEANGDAVGADEGAAQANDGGR